MKLVSLFSSLIVLIVVIGPTISSGNPLTDLVNAIVPSTKSAVEKQAEESIGKVAIIKPLDGWGHHGHGWGHDDHGHHGCHVKEVTHHHHHHHKHAPVEAHHHHKHGHKHGHDHKHGHGHKHGHKHDHKHDHGHKHGKFIFPWSLNSPDFVLLCNLLSSLII